MAIAFIIGICVSVLCAQNSQSDEAQIRELIKKFSLMWTQPNGIQIAEETTSSNFLYVINQRSFNKEQYIQFFTSILQSNQPKTHTHEIFNIRINGNLAYEYGLIEMEMKNGNKQKTESLNVFIKENGEWKLLSNMPVGMMKEVLSK
jgi:hypothetical protein